MMGNGLGLHAPIFLVGATGTGKSAAAMEVARDWARAMGGAESAAILVMDAMQVYRGADIGTSKPTAAERAEVPHGGLDLVEFGGAFDVAHYLRHAEEFLREEREAGRRVIVVGGTGLYFRALTRGLCEAPQGPDELRAELAALSVAELRDRLQGIDPGMLAWIDVSNPRRLARAIEVKEATGRSLREWQEETPEPLVREFTAFWIQREKGELEARIEARVEAMFAAGWVEEVRGLVGRHGVGAVRNFAAIGYREIGEATEFPGQGRSQVQLGNEGRQEELILRQAQDDGVLSVQDKGQAPAGVVDADRAEKPRPSPEGPRLPQLPATVTLALKRDILVATRQYAKRQLTWFAREPNLQPVMLTGNQSFSAVLRAL